MQIIGPITVTQVRQLLETGHVVGVYPRKGEIVVDGFKRYSATPAVCKAAKQ